MITSQKTKIREHLRFYGSITPLEALNLFGCMRLSQRIRELKDEGLEITTLINTGKKKYAIYVISQLTLF